MSDRRKFDDFSSFARQYRQIGAEELQSISGVDSDYFSEYKLREIAQWESIGEEEIVLDFGCGDGNSAQYFFKHCPVKAYYGADVDSESITVAQERGLDNCTFSVFDGEHLPYKDKTFDVVFISCVFHHIDSSYYAGLLYEINRVLKPGGRLYIFEHNPFNPVTRKIVHDCPFDANAVLVPAKRMRKLLKENFTDIHRRYTIFIPRKRGFFWLLPLEKYLFWCPLGGQYYYRCKKNSKL